MNGELAARPSTAEMLERLVSFDTTSRNSNLALIDFVRSWLDRNGVRYRVSTDPADGQAWTGDPFALRRRGERLIARGACDMKGFVAACLAAVPDLQARALARPIHLFITYDEEIGCQGARRLIEDLSESGMRPALCIVGEPTGMQPVLAHKGKLNLGVRVRGRTGHSSAPDRGVNAVQAAGEAVAWVAAEARRLAQQGPFEDGFDPPHTTIHVGTIRGGTILNIIPEDAEFVMEWRHIPGDDPRAHLRRYQDFVAANIEPAMHRVAPDTGFTFDVLLQMPGLSLAPDHALATLVKQLTGANATGKVSYGTEGGYYEQAGIPAIICGPGHIAQAHQPDEWIAQQELDACDAFIRRLADRLGA